MNYENSELWEAMRQTKFNNTLDELKNVITDADDIDGTLDSMLAYIVKAIHAETGTFWFYDKANTNSIYARAAYGNFKANNITLKFGEGITGNVIKDNAPVIIKDCSQDPRWNKKADLNTGFTTKSMICVPLMLENSEASFGALQIINKTDGLFDNTDLDFALKLAQEAVRLFVEKTDADVLAIIGRRKIDLHIDEILNELTEKTAKKRIKHMLSKQGVGLKSRRTIEECVLTMYKELHSK